MIKKGDKIQVYKVVTNPLDYHALPEIEFLEETEVTSVRHTGNSGGFRLYRVTTKNGRQFSTDDLNWVMSYCENGINIRAFVGTKEDVQKWDDQRHLVSKVGGLLKTINRYSSINDCSTEFLQEIQKYAEPLAKLLLNK